MYISLRLEDGHPLIPRSSSRWWSTACKRRELPWLS